MKRLLYTLLLMIGSGPTAVLVAQDPASLLASAVYEEEVSGDLQNAIELYDRIIKAFPSDRPVAAEALMRLGLAHEKLGRANAREFYHQLIDNYADQTKLAARARRRLADLDPQSPEESVTEQMATHRLQTTKVLSMPFFYGSISPDEKYFSYTSWETGDLAIYNRQSNTSRVLPTGASWTLGGFCDRSIWSPDSKQIAFCWMENRTTQIRRYDLVTDRIDSLSQTYRGHLLWPLQYTRDGSAIVCSWWDRAARRMRIVYIDAQSGELDEILLIPKRTSCAGCGWLLSNNGQYMLHGKRDTITGIVDIYLMKENEASDDRPLIEDASIKRIAAWTPNDDGFLYYSDISGYHGLWKASLNDRMEVTDTELLLEGLTSDYVHAAGTMTIGVTDSETYYYSQSSNFGNIYTVDFDPENLELFEPQAVPSANPRPRSSPFWSRDGRSLAYFRTGEPNARHVLELQDLQSGIEQHLDVPGGRMEGTLGNLGKAQWSNDGRKFLFTEVDQDSVYITLFNQNTAELRRLAKGQGPKIFGPSGTVIYADNHGSRSRVIQTSLQEDSSRIVYSSQQRIFDLTLSPDSNNLCVVEDLRSTGKGSMLSVVSLSDTVSRVAWETERGIYFSEDCPVNWLHDGAQVLVSVFYRDSTSQQLFLLDTESGENRPIGNPRTGRSALWRSIRIHPNENTLVFGIWHDITNIWALRNY